MLIYISVLQIARSHQGHIHEYQEGCFHSIFAGPTIGEYAYFLDWSSTRAFAAKTGTWVVKKEWPIPVNTYNYENYALTESSSGDKACLFHFHYETTGTHLKYALFDVNDASIVEHDVGNGCPVMAQPKARTLHGQVFLSDMSVTAASAVYKFNDNTGECTAMDNAADKVKETMMGVFLVDGHPSDWLYFWSFDLQDLGNDQFRIYFLSRQRASPHNFTVFTYDTGTSEHLTAWNMNVFPIASPYVHNTSTTTHLYGDIFYVGPNETVVVLTGDLGSMPYSSWDPCMPQIMDNFIGKMIHITNDDAQDVHAEICACGFRHPYHNQINRDNNVINIGDVGSTQWEEFNIGTCNIEEPPANYGWPKYEGVQPRHNCSIANGTILTEPTMSFEHCFGSTSTSSLSTGAIIGISAAGLAVLLAIVYYFKRPQHAQTQSLIGKLVF